ncbi:MAG: MFS transporter [Desulfobacteraceae bacterium]|nr:MFS transporter [Desulfobacteraceae bacterium]
MPDADNAEKNALISQVFIATFFKLVLNTAKRLAYPFAPVLSRGLDVPLSAITSVIAVNQFAAVFGLFVGPYADRFGYRIMMMAGIAMLTLGMFITGLFPFYLVLMAGMILAGCGKTIFDPAIQGFVGKKVPYHRRGQVIGILEFAWAGSTIVGIPVVAVVIDRLGWRAPFFIIGGLGLIGIFVISTFFPADNGAARSASHDAGILAALLSLLKKRHALGLLGFVFFVSTGNDALFVIYGAWLEQDYALSILGLGAGTSVIGLAELIGETGVAVFSDRLGLKRSMVTGVFLTIAGYAFLPLAGGSLISALLILFLIFLFFEFTVVVSMSLGTELIPEYRATMMSGFYAAAGIGRVVGAVFGGPLWVAGGISATAVFSGMTTLIGFACLLWGRKKWRPV